MKNDTSQSIPTFNFVKPSAKDTKSQKPVITPYLLQKEALQQIKGLLQTESMHFSICIQVLSVFHNNVQSFGICFGVDVIMTEKGKTPHLRKIMNKWPIALKQYLRWIHTEQLI